MRSMIAGLFVIFALSAAAAQAQPGTSYPDRTVRLINPFSPGGSSDPAARLLADSLSKRLGQQVIVENKSGAQGNIGTALVAHSAPDGYTLLFASGTAFTVNPFLYSSLGFDPKNGFDPVIKFGTVPIVLVVHPSLKASNVRELIELAKKNPGKLTYASAGAGSSMHLAAELFQKMTGTKMLHVPYASTGQAVQDTVAHHTDLVFHLMPAVAGQVKAGTLRALTILSATRSDVLPKVPTAAEAGLPGLEAGTWYAVMAPKGTPHAIIDRINDQTNQALNEPDFRKRVLDMGITPLGGTPADVLTYIDQEIEKWSAIVRSIKTKAD